MCLVCDYKFFVEVSSSLYNVGITRLELFLLFKKLKTGTIDWRIKYLIGPIQKL